MNTPRETSLRIFYQYLEEWCREAQVPINGYGDYTIDVEVRNKNITSLRLSKSQASINLK